MEDTRAEALPIGAAEAAAALQTLQRYKAGKAALLRLEIGRASCRERV